MLSIYAECQKMPIMLSVIMLSGVMLNVVMLNVDMLSVVAPFPMVASKAGT
jgi:hypothetical protein